MVEIIICVASGALVACLISIAVDVREINKIMNGVKKIMIKAFVNGVEVTVYEYRNDEAKCFIPSMGICNWYKLSMIEVRE